jgi:hypothetical protein
LGAEQRAVTGQVGKHIRQCRFVTDSKRHDESFWFCTTHRARVSDSLVPCFFSRYDGTPLESNPDQPSKVTAPFKLAEERGPKQRLLTDQGQAKLIPYSLPAKGESNGLSSETKNFGGEKKEQVFRS